MTGGPNHRTARLDQAPRRREVIGCQGGTDQVTCSQRRVLQVPEAIGLAEDVLELRTSLVEPSERDQHLAAGHPRHPPRDATREAGELAHGLVRHLERVIEVPLPVEGHRENIEQVAVDFDHSPVPASERMAGGANLCGEERQGLESPSLRLGGIALTDRSPGPRLRDERPGHRAFPRREPRLSFLQAGEGRSVVPSEDRYEVCARPGRRDLRLGAAGAERGPLGIGQATERNLGGGASDPQQRGSPDRRAPLGTVDPPEPLAGRKIDEERQRGRHDAGVFRFGRREHGVGAEHLGGIREHRTGPAGLDRRPGQTGHPPGVGAHRRGECRTDRDRRSHPSGAGRDEQAPVQEIAHCRGVARARR